MDIDFFEAIDGAMRGCFCRTIRLENGWSFAFSDTGERACSVFVSAPWRIVSGKEIAHAVDDDGQRFGLPEPVDGETKANGLLEGKRVRSFIVDPITADLRVQFDDGVRLDVFTNSAGYESWNASFEVARDEVTLVGGGGGNLSFVSVPKGSTPKVVFGQSIPKP
jgi:hypothetical protein